MAKNIRNIAVVLVLAGLVVAIPGGGRGATVAIQAVSLAFLASIVWIASILYRQHRNELYSLGDTRRGVLYVALGVAVVTFSATTKLWATAAGELVWFALIGAAVYAVIAIVWSARRY